MDSRLDGWESRARHKAAWREVVPLLEQMAIETLADVLPGTDRSRPGAS